MESSNAPPSSPLKIREVGVGGGVERHLKGQLISGSKVWQIFHVEKKHYGNFLNFNEVQFTDSTENMKASKVLIVASETRGEK